MQGGGHHLNKKRTGDGARRQGKQRCKREEKSEKIWEKGQEGTGRVIPYERKAHKGGKQRNGETKTGIIRQ